ncbi:MAG TPA: HNH endonuclease signature motif containing protein [Thermoanaerobaculia bacterium]|nr:HNH endonuclease signature motif containing protein [Thermoanaerobaculia bacterium]
MAIADKSRKLLWARSGNRCALCKCELIMKGALETEESGSVIGDECHIVSLRHGGPRYNPTFSAREVDEYANLILLCKVHHKVVDDQHEAYPAEWLKQLKHGHEEWVRERLGSGGTDSDSLQGRSVDTPYYLIRITSGSELLTVVDGMCASSFSCDELLTEDEVRVVGGFLQNLEDWGDLAPEFGPGRKVRVGFELTNGIRELDEQGFWVFACREIQVLEGRKSGVPSEWPVAHVRVVRKASDEIVRLERQDDSSKDD